MESSTKFWTTIKEYAVPYYNHTYHSNLSAEEIRERLHRNIDTKERSLTDMVFRSGSEKNGTYRGTFNGDSFKIHRIKRGKNSYRPVIIGAINSSINTTQVQVTMRLSYFNMISAMVSICILIYIVIVGDSYNGFTESNYVFLLVAIFVGYAITTISFNIEATKAKRFLKQILQPIEKNTKDDWIIRN